MIKNLTLTQKMFIALSLPLIIVIINSLMAVIQLQNYQRMIKYEIVNIQESDSIKDDLGKILEKSDKKAKTTMLTIVLRLHDKYYYGCDYGCLYFEESSVSV